MLGQLSMILAEIFSSLLDIFLTLLNSINGVSYFLGAISLYFIFTKIILPMYGVRHIKPRKEEKND